MSSPAVVSVPPVVALLADLVRAASPNPPGDERAVAGVARAWLQGIPGVRVEDVGVAPERPMLVATLDGAVEGPTLVMCGHLDTVPAGDGWGVPPFGAEVRGDRLYGRGAVDMKAGVAGIMAALRELAGRRSRWRGRVVLHLVPDEEPGGMLGVWALARAGRVVADAALVAEPSGLLVNRAQKGNVFATLSVVGRAAHGSMPANGVNAIAAAARLVVDLEDRLAPVLARRTHPLVGPATISVGRISGGRATNVVPDACTVSVDRRLVPGETTMDAVAELEAFCAGRATVTVDNVGEPFETAEDTPLVDAALDAVEAVTAARPACGGLVGGSDARAYAGAGIPTILLGPGSMDQAHVVDEWVDLAQVRACVSLYVALVERLQGTGEGGVERS